MEKNHTTKVNECILLGINVNNDTGLKSYVIGFADSSFNVDDNCPHNLIPVGVAGVIKNNEDLQDYFTNVCLIKISFDINYLYC